MSESVDLHPVQFIDNYFPVIDGVTETVHQYAQHMNAVVVCPEMESHYLEKHDFPYPVLTSMTALGALFPVRQRGAEDGPEAGNGDRGRNPDIFHLHSPPCWGNTRSAWEENEGSRWWQPSTPSTTTRSWNSQRAEPSRRR